MNSIKIILYKKFLKRIYFLNCPYHCPTIPTSIGVELKQCLCDSLFCQHKLVDMSIVKIKVLHWQLKFWTKTNTPIEPSILSPFYLISIHIRKDCGHFQRSDVVVRWARRWRMKEELPLSGIHLRHFPLHWTFLYFMKAGFHIFANMLIGHCSTLGVVLAALSPPSTSSPPLRLPDFLLSILHNLVNMPPNFPSTTQKKNVILPVTIVASLIKYKI